MLYNTQALFLHYPKTAGKSASLYFCKNFRKPIYGMVSKGQFAEINMNEQDGVFLTEGRGHENLHYSEKKLAEKGQSIRDLEDIIVVTRNPYDLMVSNYFFLKQKFRKNTKMREKPNFILAAENDFSGFCEKFQPADFRNWVELDNKKPQNLHLLRFETLEDDFRKILKQSGLTERHRLQTLNKSIRPAASEMYDSTSKKHVDEKFDALFYYGEYEKRLV